MLYRFLVAIVLASAVFLPAMPAMAQWENIETVEGPYGEKTTLTEQPHTVAEGLSVRALGIVGTDTTRWALSLIGAEPEDSISLVYEEETLPIKSIERPSGGVGPIKVFLSQEAFLTMAETGAVKLRVGNRTASFPAQLRREMKQIFERVA